MDTEATIAEAADLWKTVDRPNVLIKIPATEPGLPAITATIAEGISVNVTLIFALERYQGVIDAYHGGVGAGGGQRPRPEHDPQRRLVLRLPRRHRGGQAAGRRSAPTRRRRSRARRRSPTPGWRTRCTSGRSPPTAGPALEAKGANRQRPLWASTGVKDPACPDTLYVTELVVANTVNTMPEKTMDAFADHGEVTGDTVSGREDEAQADAGRASPNWASTTTTSSPSWRPKASTSSRSPGTSWSRRCGPRWRARTRKPRSNRPRISGVTRARRGPTRFATPKTAGCRGSPGPASW